MEDLQPDARTIARIPAQIASGNWCHARITVTRPPSVWLPVSAGAASAPPWVGMLVFPEELARGSIPAASIQHQRIRNGAANHDRTLLQIGLDINLRAAYVPIPAAL